MSVSKFLKRISVQCPPLPLPTVGSEDETGNSLLSTLAAIGWERHMGREGNLREKRKEELERESCSIQSRALSL